MNRLFSFAMKYESETNPFYLTPRWQRKRAAILRQDKYLCQECKRYGRMREAKTVHHIKHLRGCTGVGIRGQQSDITLLLVP